MSRTDAPPLLRARHGGHSKVTNEELFFDLLYAFAITQLSHFLLDHLTLLGALQTAALWFGVWLGWQYTMWVTNWFDPENRATRLLLFASMLLGLVMASAIPDAFGAHGLQFATCYVAIQVGRTVVLVWRLKRAGDRGLLPNFERILGWLCISGLLWLAGGVADAPSIRLGCWIAAVACEYLSPMLGFALPGLGRSRSWSDWNVDGGHIAERCQLFVMIALGESVVATGGGFGGVAHPDASTLLALVVTFAGSIAMWWLYFDTASGAGAHAITHAADPGRVAARFSYLHVTLIGGIIVDAVGNELVMHHPDAAVDLAGASVLVGGPLLFVLANAAFKKVVYGRWPPSHLIGAAALAALFALTFAIDRLEAGAAASLVLIAVGAWHSRHRPTLGQRPSAPPSAAR